MPTRQPASSHAPSIEIDSAGDCVANYPTFVFRFLFSDGRTLDVFALRDDSELREAVRLFAKADRIEGVAKLIPDAKQPDA